MLTVMAKGKTINDALKMTNELVVKELGGLPEQKLHCSNMGADALQNAIKDYLGKKENIGWYEI